MCVNAFAAMVKILMLILACDSQPYYKYFQNAWRLRMHNHPGAIEAWFYKANPHQEDPVHVDAATSTVSVKMAENWDSIYPKFLATLQHFAPRLHEFDYLFRPNLSSFVLLDRYLAQAKTWPRTKLYKGVIGHFYDTVFASGAAFTLSMDCVHLLISAKTPTLWTDDVTVGKCMQEMGIAPTPDVRSDVADPSAVPGNIYIVRAKTEHDRLADVVTHFKMQATFYGPPAVTFVTMCLYANDATRSLADLVARAELLLSLPVYLYLFCDAKTRPLLQATRDRYGVGAYTHYHVLEKEDMWTAQFKDAIEANRATYWPTADPRAGVWSHLFSCSKPDLMLIAQAANPFGTSTFAWTDSGNIVGKMGTPAAFLNLAAYIALEADPARFYIQRMGVVPRRYVDGGLEVLRDYYAAYRYQVCGGLFVCSPQRADVLYALKEAFVNAVHAGVGHGDEMLYVHILPRFRDVIRFSYGDFQDMVANFITPTQNHEYIYGYIAARLLAEGFRDDCAACCKTVLASEPPGDYGDKFRALLEAT